ncbi:glycosyltransferase, partial [Rhodococcus sp. ENV425]
LWEPTGDVLAPPSGDGPLVMVAPSTAATGVPGLLDAVCTGLGGSGMRIVVAMLEPPERDWPDGVVAGHGRQDLLLEQADVVVCGGGHGMLAKALRAGVPAVVVPGGGDQWELANRAARQGSAVVVRPLDSDALRAAVDTVLTEPRFTRAARLAAATATQVEDPVTVCRSVVAPMR